MGCQSIVLTDDTDVSNALVEEKANYPLELTGNEYILLKNEGITVEHPDNGTVLEIPASDPGSALWSSDRRSIFWVEKEAIVGEVDERQQYFIYEFSLYTGQQKNIAWSKSMMTNLSLSWQSHFIAFEEGRSLYILHINSGQVQRVTEDVNEWKWSPGELALIISNADSVNYTVINADGSVASEMELLDDTNLQGVEFLNKKQVVGFSYDKNPYLLQIDLRIIDEIQYTAWQHGTVNDNQDIRYDIVTAPSEKYISVQEQAQGKRFGTIILYNIKVMQTRGSIQNATVIGWRNSDIIVVARKDSKQNTYTMAERSVAQNKETIIAKELPSIPILIQQ